MRLILQCAVCGTVHPVGASVCATCQATGLQNLRLMFECLACFRLVLAPRCEACHPKPTPPPFEVVPDPIDPEELARRWGVADEVMEPGFSDDRPADALELTLDDLDSDRGGVAIDDSGFDILLDEDLPVIDPDDGPGYAGPRE